MDCTQWDTLAGFSGTLWPLGNCLQPFRKWIDDGILDNIFRVLKLEAELEELSIDASIVQAHQHSVGAKKGGNPMKSDIVAEEPVQKSMQR